MLDMNLDGLKSALRQHCNYLLQKLKHRHYRIPEMVWDPNFMVELATTKEDLEAIFKLQHESYVSRGLMRPHPSGLKCSVFHFLPQTNHVVVKFHGRVIAAVTLVSDSSLGLPADKFFEDEINLLRQEGHKVVELTSFVVDKGYKPQTKALIHLLMKYSLNYVRRFLECSEVVVTVHPNMSEFYKSNWFFQPKSDVIKFHSAKSAFTQLMTHSLDRNYRRYFVKSFPSMDPARNAAVFVAKKDYRFIYPTRKEGQVVLPVMTPDLLEYFFLKKTNLYEDLDLQTRQVFLEMYLQFFGEEEIERFLNLEHELILKEFRIPISTRCAIKAGPQFYIGRIRDITSSGCFVELPQEIKNITNETITLSFKIGDSSLQVQGVPSWRNKQNQLRYGHGYGFRFERQIDEVNTEIKNWLPVRGAA